MHHKHTSVQRLYSLHRNHSSVMQPRHVLLYLPACVVALAMDAHLHNVPE
jgi:hypothetical protein